MSLSPVAVQAAPYSIDPGAQATATWDPCPLFGVLHVRVVGGGPGLVDGAVRAAGDGVASVEVSDHVRGGVVLRLRMAPGVVHTEVRRDAGGALTVLASGSGEEEGTSLVECLARATARRGPLGTPPAFEALPVGRASPWSFVPRTVQPVIGGGFLTVDDGGLDADPPASAIPATDPLLSPGLEARALAMAGEDPAWWVEAAGRFQLAAAVTMDTRTLEAATALAGEALLAAGALDEAFEYFHRAASLSDSGERSPWYLLGQGLAAQGMGRHDLALERLERAGEGLPERQRYVPLLAMISSLAAQDRYGDALALRDAVNRGWSEQARWTIDPWLEAELVYRVGDPDELIDALDRLEDLDDPRRPLVHLRRADLAMVREDRTAFDEALRKLGESGAGAGVVMKRIRELEWMIVHGGGVAPSDVLSELRKLGDLEPRASLEVALLEGAYLVRSSMLVDACRLDRETLRTHREFPGSEQVEARMCGAASTLIDVALAGGDDVRAAGLFLEFVEGGTAPECSDTDLRMRMVPVLEGLSLRDEAQRVLTGLLVSTATPSEVRRVATVRLAGLYLERGLVDEGLKTVEFRRRRQGAAEDRDLDLVEARLRVARGETERARELAAAVAASGDADQVRLARGILGRLDLAAGNPSSAAEHLEASRPVPAGEEVATALLLGWALLQAGRPGAAEQVLGSLDPESMGEPVETAWFALRAMAAHDRGEEQRRRDMLDEAIALGGDDLWVSLARSQDRDRRWERQVRDLLAGVDRAEPDGAVPSEL